MRGDREAGRGRAAALGLAVALAVAGGGTRAYAGTLPRCDPAPTPATFVKHADLVVMGRAVGRTHRMRGSDALRTRFAATRVLKGSLPRRRFVVDDCWHWKCQSMRFSRGQKVVLLLVKGERRGHFDLMGPRCTNGFNQSVLDVDPADSRFRAVMAALTPPSAAPPRSR